MAMTNRTLLRSVGDSCHLHGEDPGCEEPKSYCQAPQSRHTLHDGRGRSNPQRSEQQDARGKNTRENQNRERRVVVRGQAHSLLGDEQQEPEVDQFDGSQYMVDDATGNVAEASVLPRLRMMTSNAINPAAAGISTSTRIATITVSPASSARRKLTRGRSYWPDPKA